MTEQLRKEKKYKKMRSKIEFKGPFYLERFDDGNKYIKLEKIYTIELDIKKQKTQQERRREKKWPLLRRIRIYNRKKKLL